MLVPATVIPKSPTGFDSDADQMDDDTAMNRLIGRHCDDSGAISKHVSRDFQVRA
jgi:hypothetical protein